MTTTPLTLDEIYNLVYAAMRNAGIVAVALYIAAHYLIYPYLGATGIWVAFLFYYVVRAVTLVVAYPAIRRAME